MNKKWYICALIAILALIGGFATQEHSQTPNQEIVLQFSNEEVNSDKALKAIASVKEQLQSIGVHNIHISDYQEGYLKITYFSATDVASIKKLFTQDSQESDNQFPSDSPSEEYNIHYNLDVYEIQQGYNDALQLSGKLGIEHKADNDRLSNTNTYANTNQVEYKLIEPKTNVAYRFQNHIGLTIDHITHKIPEVRAGPHSIGIFNLSA